MAIILHTIIELANNVLDHMIFCDEVNEYEYVVHPKKLLGGGRNIFPPTDHDLN